MQNIRNNPANPQDLYDRERNAPLSRFLCLSSSSLSPLCHLLSRIGLPYTESLVDRTLLEVSGTVLAARLALEFGLACNLAGGTHHAYRDFGSGYKLSFLSHSRSLPCTLVRLL